MRKVGIGVIGCGVISKAYLTAMKQFSNIELRAVADMRSAAAEQRAKDGVPGMRSTRCCNAMTSKSSST